jgi:alkyl hydroperoxide reductase subunit D
VSNLENLSASLNESCKDLRLNLSSVLRSTTLPAAVARSVALTSAYFCRLAPLAEALIADGKEELSANDITDAQAAASLMGMTTIYYRFRHLVGNPAYGQLRPSLRMNRMMSPATSRGQFELCAMACAALAGCETCIQSHEASLTKEGYTQEQIHEAVRIGAVVAGYGIALEIPSAIPA